MTITRLTPKIGLEIAEYETPRIDLIHTRNWDKIDALGCACPALVTTLTDVKPVDVFVYDTTKDSDGGAWRDRCQALSWYTEDLNTATRGGTRKFPAIVGVVAETNKVTLFDLTMPDAPMWMVFIYANNYMIHRDGSSKIECVSMKQGLLAVGGVYLQTVSFLSDVGSRYGSNTNFSGFFTKDILNRNGGWGITSGGLPLIVNVYTHDVAMTLIEDKAYELVANGTFDTDSGWTTTVDESYIADGVLHILGSAISTVAVQAVTNLAITYTITFDVVGYTSGTGVSVGFNGGTKEDVLFSSTGSYSVDVTGNGGAFEIAKLTSDVLCDLDNVSVKEKNASRIDIETGLPTPTIAVATDGGVSVIDGPAGIGTVVDVATDYDSKKVLFDEDNGLWFTSRSGVSSAGDGGLYLRKYNTIPSVDTPASWDAVYSNSFQAPDLVIDPQGGGVQEANCIGYGSIGYPLHLTLLDEDIAIPANGMVNYITKDYQSGWMQGAIAGAWLATIVEGPFLDGEEVEDRSVNANPLTVVGTNLTRTPVASGAELVGCSGFTTSDYLEQPYNSDLDFGTGDFCIMGWFRLSSIATGQSLITRENREFAVETTAVTGTIRLNYFNIGDTLRVLLSTTTVTVGEWFFVCGVLKPQDIKIYMNGVLDNSTIESAAIDSGAGALTLGARNTSGSISTQADNSEIALVRISATAPSDEQIAKIYEDEKKLFTSNTKCTLQGDSSDVTALAVDDSTDILYVGTGSGATTFNGLLATTEEVCVRKDDGTIACTDNDEYVSISAQREIVIHGIADNSIVNAGTVNLRAALIELEAQLEGKQDKLDIELNPYIDFPNLTTQPPWKEGRVFYNATKHCLSFYNDVTDMTVDVPLEEVIRVKNVSGATIANGKPIYVTGIDNGMITIDLAIADSFATSSVPGFTTHEIDDGEEGFITHAGAFGADLSAYAQGELMYLSDTVAGEMVNTAPDIATKLGMVISNAVDGSFQVKINSNIALPTITGVLNDGAAGAYIDSNYEAIVDYLSSHQVGIPVDDLTGQITIPTVGLYKININFNVTFDELTSNNPVVVELQVWNVTTYSEELVIPCTAVKGGNGVALSPTFTHDFTTAGQIFELRVRCQEQNLTTIVYQLVSFDVESVHLRA